jgi:hypothetical protein
MTVYNRRRYGEQPVLEPPQGIYVLQYMCTVLVLIQP